MRSKAVINVNNIYHNIDKFLDKVDIEKFMIVVKANAYGHGLMEMVKIFYDKNIKWYGVATAQEALRIKELYNDVKVLILGPVENEYYELLEKKDIHFTVADFDSVDYIVSNKLNCNIHLALDTGMGRIGFTEEEIDIVLERIKPVGIFSHLAEAEINSDFTKEQIRMFKRVASKYDFKYKHLLNSYGTFNYYEDFYDIFRIGIMVYGGDDTNKFLPTISLYSEVSFIKKLDKDMSIGYGRTYFAKKGDYIATVSIGYADGVSRKLSNKGQVFIKGKKYNIVGNICMDQMMVLVDENIKKGDLVEIFGSNIPIKEVAKLCDTISYEIMCSIGTRVVREYRR